MLSKFHGSTMVFAAAALLCASLSLTGCEKAQDGKDKAEMPKQEAPAPAPAAPEAPQPAPVVPQAPAASADSSIEVKSHIKQGLSYVSTAKNAQNKALFDENIGNALKEFSLAIEKDPDYADAYSNRGVAYMQQHKFNKALEDLKKAKELKSDSPSIRYNLACLYSLKGDVDFGLDELDAALANGFSDYESLRKDPDLNNLRKHPEFKKILEAHKVFIVK
ncbi:MAG: tetratricopeptide repeat protein [Syntrophus sp. (in: bacteria)]|nr:tetratricopeptide repeat protein [Syntrophus sp. (in: bacteria)]